MLQRFWRAVRRFADQPLKSARSGDELAQRREIQHMYSLSHAMADLPRPVRVRTSKLVYTELNRRGVTIWRAA